MQRRTPVWDAPDEIIELMGPVSGNELNGWGEADERQPTLVMWANPRDLAHGPVQQRMTVEFMEHPQLRTALRPDDRHTPVDVADVAVERTAAQWLEEIQHFATDPGSSEQGAELVGVTPIERNWWFEGRAQPWTTAIILGLAMDHGELATAPEYTSAMEVHRQYNRGTASARALADWLRVQGIDAVGHGGPGAGPIQMVPAAIAAGLGELGKHGSIINRELGSSFRLAVVLTNLAIAPTARDTFGVDDFCLGCRVCTDACPPDAIAPDMRLVRGIAKWAVDFDRCLPYFAVSHGCGICIAVCPWSTPGEAPRLAANMERKLARKAASVAPREPLPE